MSRWVTEVAPPAVADGSAWPQRPRAERVLRRWWAAWRLLRRHRHLAWKIVRLRLALPRRFRQQPLERLLDDLSVARARGTRDLALIERLTALLLAGRSPLATTCLFRALVRYALIAPLAGPVVLCLGLRRDGSGGHAWLEQGGQVLFGDSRQGCTVTYRYPRRHTGAFPAG